MNLAIDIGNTASKYGIFMGSDLISAGVVLKDDFSSFDAALSTNDIHRVIYSAVAEVSTEFQKRIHDFPSVVALTVHTKLPIRNDYLTPDTLGKDRLANACAAASLFPNAEVLVIDAGTCLKFDFVSSDGSYKGGGISPGLRMRFKALSDQTAHLPLLMPQSHPELIGRNTVESIQSGVVNGMMGEINEIIRQYFDLYPRLEVILTGGDADFFLNQFKSRIFAAPYLTLIGLNHIVLNLPYE